MITNQKMYKNLWDRRMRGEDISEERIRDCLLRTYYKGENEKYTGPEKFKYLIWLKRKTVPEGFFDVY